MCLMNCEISQLLTLCPYSMLTLMLTLKQEFHASCAVHRLAGTFLPVCVRMYSTLAGILRLHGYRRILARMVIASTEAGVKQSHGVVPSVC